MRDLVADRTSDSGAFEAERTHSARWIHVEHVEHVAEVEPGCLHVQLDVGLSNDERSLDSLRLNAEMIDGAWACDA